MHVPYYIMTSVPSVWYSFVSFGVVLETATVVPSSTCISDRHLAFTAAEAQNPTSHKEDVTTVISMRGRKV